jgi:hypothetical protein
MASAPILGLARGWVRVGFPSVVIATVKQLIVTTVRIEAHPVTLDVELVA